MEEDRIQKAVELFKSGIQVHIALILSHHCIDGNSCILFIISILFHSRTSLRGHHVSFCFGENHFFFSCQHGNGVETLYGFVHIFFFLILIFTPYLMPFLYFCAK